jgi:hypothetical protein
MMMVKAFDPSENLCVQLRFEKMSTTDWIMPLSARPEWNQIKTVRVEWVNSENAIVVDVVSRSALDSWIQFRKKVTASKEENQHV